MSLSKEQILLEYAKCVNDTPYALKTYLQTYDNTQSKYVPLELFNDQVTLVKDYDTCEENIALKYRQAGVSTVTSAWASKRLVFAKKSKPEKILIIANKMDTAMEMGNKVRAFVDQWPSWLGVTFSNEKNSQRHFKLTNGCEVKAVATSKDALRGYTPTILIFDEAAYINADEDAQKQVEQYLEIKPGNLKTEIDKILKEYEPVYGTDSAPNTGKTRPEELAQTGITERDITKTYDTANDSINSTVIVYDSKLEDWKKDNNKAGIVSVVIKPYGKDYNILLPGSISGLSEDFSNEVQNFKYVGSPFNTYRFTGVERSIKFELKLYYTNETEKVTMITKINSLKELMFPYDMISEMTYADSKTSQIAFSPNLIYLTIDGYYKNMFGIMDTLSVSIDDNTTWALNDFEEDSNDKPYPTVINVSFGMKVIENPIIKDKRFNYNFDGNGIKTASTIDFEKKKEVKKYLAENFKLFTKI